MGNQFDQIIDSLFPDSAEKPRTGPTVSKATVTIEELIQRKNCVLKVAGKFYKVTVTEVEVTKAL